MAGQIKSGPGISEKTPLLKLGTQDADVCPFVVIDNVAQFENIQALIVGAESQALEMCIGPRQNVMVEPGSLFHMDDSFENKVKVGSFMDGCKRCCCAGEDFFQVRYENTSQTKAWIGLSPSFPAKVVPIDLNQHSGLTLTSGSFMGALSDDLKFEYRWVQGAGMLCCGGQGFMLHRAVGTGWLFLNGGGTIVSRTLKAGEKQLVAQTCLLAFEKTVDVDVRKTGNVGMMCCGGEGFAYLVLTGPGFVLLQSMSIERQKAAIGATAAAAGAQAGAASGAASGAAAGGS